MNDNYENDSEIRSISQVKDTRELTILVRTDYGGKDWSKR